MREGSPRQRPGQPEELGLQEPDVTQARAQQPCVLMPDGTVFEGEHAWQASWQTMPPSPMMYPMGFNPHAMRPTFHPMLGMMPAGHASMPVGMAQMQMQMQMAQL